MLKRTTRLLAIGVMCVTAAHAEDIDLFIQGASNTATPNVLFVIDNTANWNQAFTNEIAALQNTFNNLPVNADGSAKFNVGILFANETGNPNNNVAGGYIRAAIRPMTNSTKALYATLIGNLDKLKDKGNGGYSALEMAEAYLYLSGGTPYAGTSKVKADFSANTCTGCNLTNTQIAADNAVYALGANALSSEYASRYNAPSTVGGCAKNFIIYISNGPNQESSSADSQANTMLAAAGGSTTTIPISPAGSMSNPSDEWARFMKESSLGVVTYTIDVDPVTSGQGPGWTALLKSMSGVSGGQYAAVSSSTGSGSAIATAVNKDLSEIQAVNSVFASVSLPVSVNTQGSYLDQVFVGMFRPDASAAPRWMGNLKQYKLDTTTLDTVDADGNPAINNQTGFITECARSYWTPNTTDTYWTFDPQGGCIPPSGSAADLYKNSNFPDGNIVEKGGQGYVLRSNTSRTMYTCSPTFSACTSLTSFATNNSAITPALLGAANSSAAASLIQWERGLDVLDENVNGVTTTEMRPSVHGDIVHSRPVAVNYGTDTAPQVVVFYGGNDGAFRAINGNQTGSLGTVAPGGELWSFVPPEFYGKIQRLYNNSPQISYPNVTASDAQPKPYGIDGPVTAYADGTHTYVYAPMRRGGRVLYAFDVTSYSSPGILWKLGCPNNFPTSGTVDDTGCSTGLSGLGQTWSSAKVLKSSGYGSGTSPMLIMGGGYDTCEDADPNTCGSAEKGRAVYVLDAVTGAVLATLATDRAVIADVFVVNSSSGLAQYAYAVDLGGNVYRITIGASAPASWTILKIASLGCSTTATCSANRKFMFAPTVGQSNGVYMLFLGSGDREKPLAYTTSGSVVNSIPNYFFRIDDNPTSSTWLSSQSGSCGSAVICLNALESISTTTTPTDPESIGKRGWYLTLSSTEQVVTTALLIYGVVYFDTHLPTVSSSTSCSSNLGATYQYAIWYADASGMVTNNNNGQVGTMTRSSLMAGGGLPPSSVAGKLTTGQAFCIGCQPCGPAFMHGCPITPPPGSVPKQPKSRVYWYLQR
jgi:type IV pilus assembly protein PilY1